MRKVITGIALVAFIALWIVLAGTIGTMLTDAPRWVQLVFFIVAGVAWVVPLRPLFRWMNRPQHR